MAGRFKGHWDELGKGMPVLCISGFASGNWMFQRMVEPLADGYRFILPDNRGMGRSPRATAPYKLADLANDLLDLMDDLGHQRFAILGLSMGGFLAQMLALRQPSRVSAMVLMCTSSSGPIFKSIFPMLSREQVEAIYLFQAEQRIQAALSPQFCPLLASSYPDVYQYVFQKRMAHQEDKDQVLLQYDAVAGFMSDPLPLSNIACPTLILAGEEDLIVPIANGQFLANSIPGATLKIIPETDHLFFLERAGQVAGMIGDFLS